MRRVARASQFFTLVMSLAAPALALAAPVGTTPAPGATPAAAASQLLVRGQMLSTSGGYLVFTNGTALRLTPGTAVPQGATIGSYVRAVIDRTSGAVVALELEPRTNVTGEIGIADVPRKYVATSPGSIPPSPPAGLGLGAVAAGASTVVIDVEVPANTPAGDDVFLSTERSNFSPAEIRMQRVDARDFTVSIALAANTKLRYTFTRGTSETVERDKTGGIVEPRAFVAGPAGLVAHDRVARWADLV